MTIGRQFFRILVAGTTAALLAACGGGGASGPSFDPQSPEGAAYVYRQAVMDLVNVKGRLMLSMAREEVEIDEAAFVEAAQDFAALSAMMIDGFENETLVAESRTDPAVWENWSDFEAKIEALEQASAELADAATSGGFDAARGLVQTTMRSCGDCHNPYRVSEE